VSTVFAAGNPYCPVLKSRHAAISLLTSGTRVLVRTPKMQCAEPTLQGLNDRLQITSLSFYRVRLGRQRSSVTALLLHEPPCQLETKATAWARMLETLPTRFSDWNVSLSGYHDGGNQVTPDLAVISRTRSKLLYISHRFAITLFHRAVI
jgi:hypothetical protein